MDYHSLVPLDAATNQSVLGFRIETFRGISRFDSLPYVVKRVHVSGIDEKALSTVVSAWSKFTHPNVIALRYTDAYALFRPRAAHHRCNVPPRDTARRA
jgi:hypothetical protein